MKQKAHVSLPVGTRAHLTPARPQALAALLGKMPPRRAAPAGPPPPAPQAAEMEALAWDELDRRGLLPRLKAERPDVFERKLRERFHAAGRAPHP